MGSIVAAAEQLAARLRPGVRATTDPARAVSDRPCVLVAPPTMDYTAATNTWRLIALSAQPWGSLDALDELDELVQAVVEVLPIERAEPGTYPLTPDTAPVPAYVLYVTT